MNLTLEQVDSLLEQVYSRYGYDFRNYARASIERRLEYFATRHEIQTFGDLQAGILDTPNLFDQFVLDLTVQVTEMFRDPEVYQVIRQRILPVLATYPRIKIWHAGCSSGEEVYSMAILLHEAKLLERSLLYATDINEQVLKTAYQGRFPLKSMKENSKNYLAAGGNSTLSEYYEASSESVQMSEFLRKKMVFSFHNLAVDSCFAEVNMVVCRNVLIYFDENLQNRVVSLFQESLSREGFLVLGNKEALREGANPDLKSFLSTERIYRDAR